MKSRSLAAAIPPDLCLSRQTHERTQMALHPVRFVRIVDDFLNGAAELGFGVLGRVRREDPCPALYHLAECPEGDALTVGQAPTQLPRRWIGVVGRRAQELVHETALADAGLPH